MTRPNRPFDATTKDLLELGPAAWLRYVNIHVSDPDGVELIDADLATVTAEADKVLWIKGSRPRIVHIELQASRDPALAQRMFRYNALLDYRHDAPVRSTVVLLRPEADDPVLSGIYERRFDGEEPHHRFRYDVVRAWEQRVEDVLAGGLATLPLAAISDVGEMGVARALAAMSDRLVNEASLAQRSMLLASTRLLMGLRFGSDEINQTLGRIEMSILGIRGIEESSTYQEIFSKGEARGEAKGEARGEARGEAKGKLEEAREILLQLGCKRLGRPEQRIRDEIEALSDLNRLKELFDRILDATTWDDLLGSPARPD